MNIEILRKEFKNILTLEERSKHFYEHYIEQINDKAIKEQLISIRNDEIKHIRIAKELVKIVS